MSDLTPAEHRAEAARALDLIRSGRFPPSTETYKNLALNAIANTLTAIAYFLEPAPVPEVPGLPPGWRIATDRDTKGDRLWGYTLTGPGGRAALSNRHRWSTSEGALTAGILHARAAVATAARNGL